MEYNKRGTKLIKTQDLIEHNPEGNTNEELQTEQSLVIEQDKATLKLELFHNNVFFAYIPLAIFTDYEAME